MRKKKRVITRDSFESELIAQLVALRYSYSVIHTYLKMSKMICTRRSESLRYHAVAHDVSLTASRNNLHALRAAVIEYQSSKREKVNRG